MYYQENPNPLQKIYLLKLRVGRSSMENSWPNTGMRSQQQKSKIKNPQRERVHFSTNRVLG